jgi:hypothetical protein
MTVCSLCSEIPFADLPILSKPWASSVVASDNEMVILHYKGSNNLQDPVGSPWHESLDTLAVSASTCGICTVVQAGVQLWLDRYRAAEKDNKVWVEFGKDRNPIPNGERLWLTQRFGGGEGFDVLVRVPASTSSVYLLTGVAFAVEAGPSSKRQDTYYV